MPATPRRPSRPIGPRRRITSWSGGWALSVGLSCGHRIYGEFARGHRASAHCPMCAGCGPEFYVCVGRGRHGLSYTFEVRRRAPAGTPKLVAWLGSERQATALAALEEAGG